MSTAKNAWRCSQCGAVNEAGSRSCVQCGKWPSLFDLQNSVEEAELYGLEDEEYEVQAFEPESLDPTTFEPEPFEPGPLEPGPFKPESDEEAEGPRWRRILTSVIVPLAFVVYLLISIFFNDQG